MLASSSDTGAEDILNGVELAKGMTPDYFSTTVRKTIEKVVVGPVNFNMPIDDLWSLMWVESDFIMKYRAARRETEIVLPEWEYNSDKTGGSRLTHCITVVDQPMPNTKTPLFEAQRFGCSTVSGTKTVLIHLSAQTPDVFSGKTFRVETLVEMKSVDGGAGTTMTVFGSVKKMSRGYYAVQMIAGRMAIAGIKDGYNLMVKMIHEHLGSLPAATTGDSSKTKEEAPSPAVEKSSSETITPVSSQPSFSSPVSSAPPQATSAVTTALLVVILCSVLVVGFDLSASRDSLSMVHRSVLRRERLDLHHRKMGDRLGSSGASRGLHWDPSSSDGGVPHHHSQPTTTTTTAHHHHQADSTSDVPRWGGVVVSEMMELRTSLSTAYWWIGMQGIVFGVAVIAVTIKLLCA